MRDLKCWAGKCSHDVPLDNTVTFMMNLSADKETLTGRT